MDSSFGNPGHAVKGGMYESFIKPYLTKNPNADMLPFLHHKAWQAFTLNVSKEDKQDMLFVEWLCGEMFKKYPEDFAVLVSSVLGQDHEVIQQSEILEENVIRSLKSEDVERELTDLMRQYKNIFESELRLWATVPYFYICRELNDRECPEPKTVEDYRRISGSTKYHAFKRRVVPLARGDFRKLIEGFNNDVRNAGEGHDDWTFTDDDTLLLAPRKPATGELKSVGTIELTKSELIEMNRQCRRRLWSMQMGLVIFLNNNDEIEKKIVINKTHSIREIKSKAKCFADENGLILNSIEIEKDKTKIVIEVKNKPLPIGESSQVFFGGHSAHDVVTMKQEIPYKYQLFGLIQYLVGYLNGKCPDVKMKINNEKDELITDLYVEKVEIEKLLLPKNEGSIPIPKEGSWPETTIVLVAQGLVPYGMGKVMQKIMDEKYNNKN